MSKENPKKIIRDIVPKNAINELMKSERTPQKDYLEQLSGVKKNSHKIDKNNVKKSGSEINSVLIPKKAKKKTVKLASILLVFLTLASFYIISPASVAEVKVKQVVSNVSVSSFIKAGEKESDIPLRIIKSNLEKEDQVKASGFEKIEKKAAGNVLIYNSYSVASQYLVAQTRLETPDGKIYRINKNITVPGMKTEDGKQIPGFVEAEVLADKAGENYNIEYSDFKIPGLKGTLKYEKFYGRTKTPISGGFIGNKPKLKNEDLKKINLKMEENLKNDILGKISLEKEEGETLLLDGSESSYSYEVYSVSGDKENAIVKGKVEFLTPAIKKTDTADYLAKKYLNNRQNLSVENFDSLSIKASRHDLKTNKEIIFKIEGEAEFIQKIDENKLRRELVETKNKDDVFKAHPEIEEATIILKPIFKRNFPKDYSKIEIKIEK